MSTEQPKQAGLFAEKEEWSAVHSDVAETVEDIRQTAKGLKDSLRGMFRRKPSEEE